MTPMPSLDLLATLKAFPPALALHAPYRFRAVVSKPVDGDTAWVVVDRGRRTYSEWRIRLRGLWLPELDDPDPLIRARAELGRDTLSALLYRGRPCLVTTHKERDSYDRYVADIFVDDYLDVASEVLRLMAQHTVASMKER